MTAIELPPFEADTGAPIEAPPPPPVDSELPPRRRRKKTEAPPPPQTPVPAVPVVSEDDKKALAGLLTTGFGVCFEIIASRRGDHWRLTRPEAERLGGTWSEPLAPLLAKHSAYIPWAVALLATSGVLMPRLEKDASKLQEAENAGTVPTA